MKEGRLADSGALCRRFSWQNRPWQLGGPFHPAASRCSHLEDHRTPEARERTVLTPRLLDALELLELISKDAGYLKTAWVDDPYTIPVCGETYRVRLFARLPRDQNKVLLKVEAQYLSNFGHWQIGTDKALLQQLISEIATVRKVTDSDLVQARQRL